MADVPKWTDDEWMEALERLTLHAHGKIARLHWRGMPFVKGGCVLPGGATPQDLAADAIDDAILGKRMWNQEAEPDFLKFLRSVVDSKVSHLARRMENKLGRRMLVAADADDPSPAYEVADPDPDPETVCADKESQAKFRSAVLTAIQGDALVEGVFSCLEADITKPHEMAELLDTRVKEINNAQKRLRRKVEQVMKSLADGRD